MILVVVEGVLLDSIVRFRRGERETAEPPRVYGSIPIEIAWTAAPALIVFMAWPLVPIGSFVLHQLRGRRSPLLPPSASAERR